MIGLKQPRIRDRGHLDRLKTLACSIPGCRRGTIDPHHIKCGPEGGGSVVASDSWALPLCRWGHHDAEAPDGVHRTGDEALWWAKHGLDPIALAQGHWVETQRLREVGEWPHMKISRPRKRRLA